MAALTLKNDPVMRMIVIILASFAGLPFAYLNFVDTKTVCGIICFALGMLLFADMVAEDFLDGMVDIRKALVLAILMCLSTINTFGDYLTEFIAYFIVFRLFYLFMSILGTLRARIPRGKIKDGMKSVADGEPEDGDAVIAESAIPFLPCLYGALVVFLFVLMAFHGNIPFVSPLNLAFETTVQFMPLLTTWKLLGLMTGVLLAFELVSYLINRKYQQVVGMGMGDVFVLPVVVSFLGGIYFTVMFALSFLFVIIAAKIPKRKALSELLWKKFMEEK